MRRPTLALSTALAAIGLSAAIAPAQQSSRAPAPNASSSADPADPMMASKATRYLLRNGTDYLAYREYARALSFFRAVEARQGELSDSERETLRKGIAKAQQGMREAVNGTRVVDQPKGRGSVQPGAFALAKPAAAEPVRLASVELPAPPPIPASDPPAAPAGGLDLPALPARLPAPAASPTPLPEPAAPEVAPTGPAATPPPPIGLELPEPANPAPSPAAQPVELPSAAPSPMPMPAGPAPEPAPPTDPSARPAEASSPLELPPAGPLPAPSEPAPAVPMPADPAPEVVAPPRLADASPRADAPAPTPSAVPEPPPAPEAPPLPSLPGEAAPAPAVAPAPEAAGDMNESILPPRLRREVEQIAQRPAGAGDRPGTGAGGPDDPNAPTSPTQGSTRLELTRAPSPTEARPIRRIPVPEEFVPIDARAWAPNRKYWAAAGTCHMTLYFQDPVLERYGQGVEQSLGPVGRYFSYPLDDPRQSNQRNQILQPFYSIGKFCFQVGTFPYKVLMDPPTEAEYDLGYYRPGDRIPADTIMITPTGVGPPLRGSRY